MASKITSLTTLMALLLVLGLFASGCVVHAQVPPPPLHRVTVVAPAPPPHRVVVRPAPPRRVVVRAPVPPPPPRRVVVRVR